jgi:hypothetical protein
MNRHGLKIQNKECFSRNIVKHISPIVKYILHTCPILSGRFMKLPSWLRRGLAAVIGAAGLAYPACAAICPRGRGYCPYPGSCLLYTDVDTNSICDYTARSVTSATPVAQSTPTVTSAMAPVPDAATPHVSTLIPSPFGIGSSPLPITPDTAISPVATATSNASLSLPTDTGFFIPDALVIGILAGVLIAILLFFLFRSGVLGVKISKAGPALGASALFALGIGEMATYLLMGEETLASAFAVVYLLPGPFLPPGCGRAGICQGRSRLRRSP